MEITPGAEPAASAASEAVMRRRALGFVVLLGVVSLFADMTYEGARSITGPFLALLGASGAVVGFVAGLGELVGYGLRLASGYLADRTRRYWGIAIFGYVLNLLAVPAIALAGRWEVAALLMIAERTGKAIRNPSRDVMLSHATGRIGRGWGFGLHEALDQIGAVLGPLLAAGVLSVNGSYRQAFALLGVAAVLALLTLAAARITFPNPSELEAARAPLVGKGLGRAYWLYLVAAALVAAGYADFPLIAFRLQKEGIASAAWVPVLYAIAMGVDALAGRWEVAALLMIAERTGKAIRNPSRDVMLSHATGRIGRGWGFGLHEALDQIGAVLGPLLAAGVLSVNGSYRQAFALLGVAAVLALLTLAAARITYPNPSELEAVRAPLAGKGLGRAYWLYLVAAALVAAGYADFPLIAFRLQKEGIAPAAWVPVLYAIAMGVDGLAALAFGKLFDRFGLPVLAVVVVASSAFAPLVFLGGFSLVVAGMVCWGIGMGAQESIMRAAIADLVPSNRRGTAYGLFNAGYGLSWFLGSALIGILFDVSVGWLVAFSITAQLAAVPILLLTGRTLRVARPG